MSYTKYYDKSFFLISIVFFTVSLRPRQVYAIGLSLPILPCDKILPIANSESYVVIIKGWEKSSRCKSGSSHNFPLKISKAACCFSVQLKGISFLRSWFKGLAILGNPSINHL